MHKHSPETQQLFDYLLKKLTGRINLLVVDDILFTAEFFAGFFDSPLFKVHTESSGEKARETILALKQPWHCWLLDMFLDSQYSALSLMELKKDFPFTVIMSALASRQDVSLVLNKGAFTFLDKDIDRVCSIFDTVCKVSALGFIMNGNRKTEYFDTFKMLAYNSFESKTDWLNQTGISARTLERLCVDCCGMQPQILLNLFHCLDYLIIKSSTKMLDMVEKQCIPRMSGKEQRLKVEECARFLGKNIKLIEKYLS